MHEDARSVGCSEIRLTVAREIAEDELYMALARATCAVPQLMLLGLRHDSVMDHHIVPLAAAMLRAKQLRELRFGAMPASADVRMPFYIATLTSFTCVRFSQVEVLVNGSKLVRGRRMTISRYSCWSDMHSRPSSSDTEQQRMVSHSMRANPGHLWPPNMTTPAH